MDRRRKGLGKRLQRARRAAGYKNQRVFAEAIGVHETSVARAEAGHDNVGSEVFTAIELGLKLPEEITTRYLATGNEELLEQVAFRKGIFGDLDVSRIPDLTPDELENATPEHFELQPSPRPTANDESAQDDAPSKLAERVEEMRRRLEQLQQDQAAQRVDQAAQLDQLINEMVSLRNEIRELPDENARDTA